MGMLQAAAWNGLFISALSLSPPPSLSLSRSFRQGVRTENLRRVRNNKQMAAECFLHGGRPLSDSNVARKAGINDDEENSVAMTQGLQERPGAHGIPAPATSLRQSAAWPRAPCPGLGPPPPRTALASLTVAQSRIPGTRTPSWGGGFLAFWWLSSLP